MHLLECHFKVVELKMHLRSLVPGAVSRGVGWEVVLGERMVEGEFGNGGSGGGWRGACVFLVERGELAGADPRRFLKMGSHKVSRSEKASEDTSQWRRTSSGGNLCLISPEMLHQALSILKVPLRTHQEDDSQVKSALPGRDFTQISSFPLCETTSDCRKV